MMACKWISFATVVCYLAVFFQDASATKLKCDFLKQTFPKCDCTTVENTVDTVVDCSSRGLTQTPKIEKSFDDTIYKLDLSNNSITALISTSFTGLKIEFLDLSGNSLQSVDNDSFQSMTNSLHTLFIEGDGTTAPPMTSLKQVSTIEHLTMRNYHIPELKRDQHLFLSMVNLKSLTIDNWKIGYMEASSFLGLGKLLTLTIINEPQLVSLPVDALREDPFTQTLNTLIISHTKITSVGFKAFHNLKKLKTLDLSHNEIGHLEPGCFRDVEDTLENINLFGNLLSNELYDGNRKIAGLSGMGALRKLDLSHNIFATIPILQTLGANQPVTLMLNKNEIKKVPANAFDGYGEKIKELHLDDNKINEILPDSFQGVNQLESLSINNVYSNPKFSLPISLVNSASSLKYLSMNLTPLVASALWDVVKKSTSLQELYLSSTELVSVPDFIFENITSLKILDLSHNQLSEITQKSLVGLRNLEKLDIENNYIQTLESCIFYDFQSPIITLSLGNNGFKCDCKIKKLIEDLKSGRVVQDPKKTPGKCNDFQNLSILNPNSLTCNPPYEEPPCGEYYTTIAPPTTQDPTTHPDSVLQMSVVDVTKNTIKATWSLSNHHDLKSFNFIVSATNGGGRVNEFTRTNLPTSTTEMLATGLNADTPFSICVYAIFHNKIPKQVCHLNRTLGNGPKKDLQTNDSASSDTAIIVGCVVAGVALIGIVIAIIVLLVFRKKPKKAPDAYTAPTQPRNFAKAELPTMADDSRTFKKAKANGKKSHPEGMQVVAISDGQTSPGPRVGRVNMMFQPEEGYEPMNNFSKQKQRGSSTSTYENDHGALPPTPGQDSRPPSYPGYYNQGFQDDKYDEIEVAI